MRIRIREQLSGLVALTALLAVGVISIITWLNNYHLVLNLRTQRLALTADLRASALRAALDVFYHSANAIATRELLQDALNSYYNEGKKDEDLWLRVRKDLEIALATNGRSFGGIQQIVIWDKNVGDGTSATTREKGEIIGRRPYQGMLGLLNATMPGYNTTMSLTKDSTKDGNWMWMNGTIAEQTDNTTLTLQAGFPLRLYPNAAQFPTYFHADVITARNRGIFMGPLKMASGITYALSMTIPIINNTSTTVDEFYYLGFVTAVVNARSIMDMIHDQSGRGNTGQLRIIGPNSPNNRLFSHPFKDNPPSVLNDTNFNYLFEVDKLYENGMPNRTIIFKDDEVTYNSFNVKSASLATAGSVAKTRNFKHEHITLGYQRIKTIMVDWIVLSEMDQSEVFEPVNKLRNILIITAFGTCAVILLFVCPLAHYAVRPIVRLKRATEKTMVPNYPNPSQGSFTSSPDFDPDDPDAVNDAEEGKRGALVSWRRRIESFGGTMFGRKESSISDGSENNRRRAFRIPGKVKERKHLIQDELTDLTTVYNEMSEELVIQCETLEDRVRERTRELEESKRQAEAANEAKSLFIANITHELRTPLNGILGMCAVCMHEDDANKIKRSLGIVFKSGELLLHLLTDLLTFSKNQYGHAIILDEKEFRIIDIATQISAIFEKQARESDISLDIKLLPERTVDMVLWGDANRIMQVIINLVSNSLKFTPEKGRIEVRINCGREMEEDFTTTRVNSINRGNSKTGSRTGSRARLRHRNGYLERTTSITNSTPPSERASSPKSPPRVSGVMNGMFTEKAPLNEKAESSSFHSPSPLSQLRTPESPRTPALDKLKREMMGDERPNSPINAKKYMFEFEVEDDGPGIPEHLQEKVFEPFVQGDLGLSRKHGGTGLGLSICNQLAKLMGGTIDLQSSEGNGSKFTMRIPLRYVKEMAASMVSGESSSARNSVSGLPESSPLSNDSSNTPTDSSNQNSNGAQFSKKNKPRLVGLSQPYFAPPLPAETPPEEIDVLDLDETAPEMETKDDERIRVLVAEDNRVNQEVVLRMLRLEEIYDVTVAKDGQEAVERIKEAISQNRRFDLVLMDIQMPNLDGLESTRQIRHMGYQYPIVALTAFAEESNIKECLDAGMNYFLSKPIRRKQLKSVLTKYCPKDPTIREESESMDGDNKSAKSAKSGKLGTERELSPVQNTVTDSAPLSKPDDSTTDATEFNEKDSAYGSGLNGTSSHPN